MDPFNIWHWVIVLGVFAVFSVFVVAANPRKKLARKPYALRTVGLFVAILVFSAIDSGIGRSLAGFGFCFMVLWSVHRAQDIGWSKWWCLLFVTPFVVVAPIFWLVLLFKPANTSGSST